jgi:hypothetical protein
VLELLLIYAVTGALSGTLAGLLGVGGGIIIVPALVLAQALEGVDPTVTMHLAVGTSLAVIVLTAISSIRAHHRRGAVLWPVVARITPGVVLGTFLGAAIADAMSAPLLRAWFGCFALVLAANLLFGRPPRPHRTLPGVAGLTPVGVVIGAVSALVGVGGGSMSVPFMTWCNVPLRKAIATSAAIGFPVAVGGSIGFAFAGLDDPALPSHAIGYLHLPAALLVGLTSMLFAPLGARIAHAIDPRWLRYGFALLLFSVGVKMLLG